MQGTKQLFYYIATVDGEDDERIFIQNNSITPQCIIIHTKLQLHSSECY